MGGGSDSQTTSTSAVPEWAKPYAQNYLDQASKVASTPYQAYQGTRTAGLNDQQYSAMDAIQSRAINGDATQNAGATYLQNLLGKGPGQNPYLDQQIAAGQKDMTQAYSLTVAPQMDRMAAQSGSFGNSGVQQMQQEAQRQFGQQLGNYSNAMRSSAYALGQQQQMQGAQLAQQYGQNAYTDASALMGVGDRLQAQQQGLNNEQYQNWQEAQNYNTGQLGVMGRALGQNWGSTTTQSGGSPSRLSTGLGAGLATFAGTGNPYLAAGAGVLSLFG